MAKLSSILSELGGRDEITAALQANLRWISASFGTNGYQGSSGYRNILGRWSAPYPETTGYLLPTLIAADPHLPEQDLISLACKQVKFFDSLKHEQGGYARDVNGAEPVVFDTAQILLGLMAVTPYLKKTDKILADISDIAQWLRDRIDEKGQFISHNWMKGHQAAYYSRIAWPLAYAEKIEGKVSEQTQSLIYRIINSRTESTSYPDAGFSPDEPALTHTLAYTLRGLWEYALVVSDKKLKRSVRKSLLILAEKIQNDQKVAGRYSTEWAGDYSFSCAAGSAQLALLYLLIYEDSGHEKFLTPVPLLLTPLIRAQRRGLSLNRGAVSSSLPIWGPYQRWRYTNWTQKFFSDVLIKVLELS